MNPVAIDKVREWYGKNFKPMPVLVATPSFEAVLGMFKAGRTDLAVKIAQERNAKIQGIENDRLRHGYRLPCWNDAIKLLEKYDELWCLGGNGSAKSFFAVFYAVMQMVTRPNTEWGFFHASEASSINQQQLLAHNYLPPEWRKIKGSGGFANVTFTKQNGFSQNRFSLPNGSRAIFFNYGQPIGNILGYKFDGVSADELSTMEFINEIRYRLWDKKGKFLLTFTPVDGWTTPVRDAMSGATVKEWKPSMFLPDTVNVNIYGAPIGHMPYILESRNPNSSVIFFHSEGNPFNDPEELRKKFIDSTLSEKKIRAYGWPEKQTGSLIVKFGDVNIITADKEFRGMVPPNPWNEYYTRLPAQGTNYMFIDPGTRKNWFIKWYRVGVDGKCYVYREWPDMATHGEWSLPGERMDGVPGPAQRSQFGRGFESYKELILEAEGAVWNGVDWDYSKAEVITERYMDSRIGGSAVPGQEEGLTMIASMLEEHRDSDERLVGPSMDFTPTSGDKVKGGEQMLVNLFDYDISLPVSPLNCPLMYVVDGCQQTIYTWREYTGIDGEKGAMKDVIDPDRYFAKAELGYVDANKSLVWGGFEE